MTDTDASIISDNRIFKTNQLLHYVHRQGWCGRVELSRELRMSNSRVCDFVQDMLDEGLLLEEHSGTDRRGRRTVPVMVNPEFGKWVGFDMEARRLRLVVLDFAGRVQWKKEAPFDAPSGRAELIDRLVGFIVSGLKEVRSKYKRIQGIGLGGAGVVDIQRGTILHYDLLPETRDLPLRELVGQATGLPCVMEDNIRALTVAEWAFGAAQHLNNFVCLAVRSGIGAGIVIDGRLHVGGHGFAGEAGYMALPLGPQPSQWKHLQDVVSEQALNTDLSAADFGLSPGQAQRAGQIIGTQLASLASFMDPEAIVLAGELIQPNSPLYDPMVAMFRRLVLPDIIDRVPLMPARLGSFGAAVGAALRCFQTLYPVGP